MHEKVMSLIKAIYSGAPVCILYSVHFWSILTESFQPSSHYSSKGQLKSEESFEMYFYFEFCPSRVILVRDF